MIHSPRSNSETISLTSLPKILKWLPTVLGMKSEPSPQPSSSGFCLASSQTPPSFLTGLSTNFPFYCCSNTLRPFPPQEPFSCCSFHLEGHDQRLSHVCLLLLHSGLRSNHLYRRFSNSNPKWNNPAPWLLSPRSAFSPHSIFHQLTLFHSFIAFLFLCHLCIVMCVHHPKSSPLTLSFVPPLLSPTFPHCPFSLVITTLLSMRFVCFFDIFIDYAITVVPFLPLHSTPPCPPPPSHIPPLQFMSMGDEVFWGVFLLNPLTFFTQPPTYSPLTAVSLFSMSISLFLCCLFILFIRFHVYVRSHGISPSLIGLFDIA